MNVLLIIVRVVLALFSSLPVLFSIILRTAYQRVRDRHPPSVYDGEMFANPSDGPYFRAADGLFAYSFYTIPVGIILVVVLLYTSQRRQAKVNRFFAGLYLCSILYLFAYLIAFAGKELVFYFD